MVLYMKGFYWTVYFYGDRVCCVHKFCIKQVNALYYQIHHSEYKSTTSSPPCCLVLSSLSYQPYHNLLPYLFLSLSPLHCFCSHFSSAQWLSSWVLVGKIPGFNTFSCSGLTKCFCSCRPHSLESTGAKCPFPHKAMLQLLSETILHNLILVRHAANEYGGWVKPVISFRLLHKFRGLGLNQKDDSIINNFTFTVE